MSHPIYELRHINNSVSCFIFPRDRFPNGFLVTYESCPEKFDNKTVKLIRYCCFKIIMEMTENSFYKKTQDWLRYNSSSILVMPAVFFNILSLIVLSRFQNFNAKTSTKFYMKSLCIFDMLTIITKFLYEVIVVRNGSRKSPIVIESYLCKFLSFSEGCCAIASIYLLIAMSIDKLICVLIPLKVGQLLTPTKAKIILSGILACAALFSSYTLFDKRAFQFEVNSDDIMAQTPTPSVLINAAAAINSSSSFSTSLSSSLSPLSALPSSLFNLSSTLSNNNQHSHHNSINGGDNRLTTKMSYDCESKWPGRKNDWVLLNNIVRVFLPILLICFCNSWIVIALAKSKRRAEAMFGMRGGSSTQTYAYAHDLRRNMSVCSAASETRIKSNSQATAAGVDNIDSCDDDERNQLNSKAGRKTSTSSRKASECGVGKKLRNHQNNLSYSASSPRVRVKGRSKTQHISIMLFSVTLGFVLLNLPFAIRTLFHRQFQEHFKILDFVYHDENLFNTKSTEKELRNAVKYEFFSSVTDFLLDLNYITNFFLYFLSGTKFRAQLLSLMRCERNMDINRRYSTVNTRMSVTNFANHQSTCNVRPQFKVNGAYRPIQFIRCRLFACFSTNGSADGAGSGDRCNTTMRQPNLSQCELSSKHEINQLRLIDLNKSYQMNSVDNIDRLVESKNVQF